MSKKTIIAIDGYSSTGKSSISKAIAEKLGLIHIDTGALYRGITYFALKNCKNSAQNIDIEKLILHLEQIHLEFRTENEVLKLYLNNQCIENEIRLLEVSENVSQIAKLPEVRHFLLEIQRNMAAKVGVIMDGRDIGTVVFPNADYKFFLTANIEERTKRRFWELHSLDIETDLETVKNNLEKRDKIDSERATAPLKPAEDSIIIDNSKMDKKHTIDLILSYIKEF